MSATPVPAQPLHRSCTQADHEALKQDRAAYLAATERPSLAPDGWGRFLELRTCLRCGSTLAMPAEEVA